MSGSWPQQPEQAAGAAGNNAHHAGEGRFKNGSGVEIPWELTWIGVFLEDDPECLWKGWPGNYDTAIGEIAEGGGGNRRKIVRASTEAGDAAINGEIVISPSTVNKR